MKDTPEMPELDVVPSYAEVTKRAPKGSVEAEEEDIANLKRRVEAINAKQAKAKK